MTDIWQQINEYIEERDSTPGGNEVICPGCAHPFEAIPLNVKLLIEKLVGMLKAEHRGCPGRKCSICDLLYPDE